MKFGQNLARNQVPEWASSYIDYKALKKLIKSAQKAIESGEEPDLAGFFYLLERQLENVDTFYNRKLGEFSRRLRLLYERYGMVSKLPDSMDKDDLEDLIATLLELRGQYRKLQWYGEVNRRGFVKITKKLNKKIPSSTAQSRYLTTKVDPKPFASNNKLTVDMRRINEWLPSLGEVKIADDADSVRSASSGSLRRIASRSTLKIPSATIDALDQAVREDDVQRLGDGLQSLVSAQQEIDIYHWLKLDLLQRAITSRATKCIDYLIQQVHSLDQEDDMNKRNCLHRLVVSIGRTRAMKISGATDGLTGLSKTAVYINAAEPPIRAPDNFKVEERDPTLQLGKDEQAEQLLAHILQRLTSQQRTAILSKDVYGRLPLHYSAQYGLAAVTVELMKCMHQWDLLDVSNGVDSVLWQDLEGYAPFHLAVIHGHYRTAKALLLMDDSSHFSDVRLTPQQVEKSGASLALATKNNYHRIVKLLVDAGVDVNYQDEQGETALHIAARFGYDECAQILLESSREKKADVELREATYGWTPLFIACVDGHLDLVKLLMSKGAQVHKPDLSGWSPQEHAALRGHLDIAKFLSQFTPPPSLHSSPEIAAQESVASLKASSLEGRRSANGTPSNGNANPPRVPEPVKTFGHRYLQKDSMILVSLGTMDERKAKDKPAVSLETIELTSAHATQLDTALSVVVSAQGAEGEPIVIDLPIQENISTSPVTFTAKDPSKMKLFFDLVPTYAGSTDKVIGRGVALLSSIKPSIGTRRMNLQGDLSVPLVSRDSLEVIGSVNFNFLIITPFSHPNMSISEDRTYWKKSSTMIIGHRGLGKNLGTKTSLQLGENTMQSFITAANLGASYVEFDVQMTKDHVPVIYHDFLVSETGADVPVHTLTLEQFLALGESSGGRAVRSHLASHNIGPQSDPVPRRFQRSYSAGTREQDLRPDMRERMKHTRDFKAKGFKGNSRGDSIQAPFATLEDLLTKLPPDVGFNIEMKYPMLFESEEQAMDTYAVELNYFVDTVLEKVYSLGRARNIIFSSFHPDICLLLSFKQPSIPVLFLTDAGTSVVGDIRASSLQEAIRFASRWNLLGIVSACEPFVMCPRLIQVVKNSGLVCFSYGSLNNDAQNSRLQAQEGIDAVIVDSVARVRRGLTGPEPGATATEIGEAQRAATNGVSSDLPSAVGTGLRV